MEWWETRARALVIAVTAITWYALSLMMNISTSCWTTDLSNQSSLVYSEESASDIGMATIFMAISVKVLAYVARPSKPPYSIEYSDNIPYYHIDLENRAFSRRDDKVSNRFTFELNRDLFSKPWNSDYLTNQLVLTLGGKDVPAHIGRYSRGTGMELNLLLPGNLNDTALATREIDRYYTTSESMNLECVWGASSRGITLFAAQYEDTGSSAHYGYIGSGSKIKCGICSHTETHDICRAGTML